MVNLSQKQKVSLLVVTLITCLITLYYIRDLYQFDDKLGLVSYHKYGDGLNNITNVLDTENNNNNISHNNNNTSNYILSIIEWSNNPYSFCFENYKFHNLHNKHSDIAILSISNLAEQRRHSQTTKEFIFYLRLTRILYANKYNYKYCEFQASFDISKPPHWSKFNSIRILSTLQNIKHIIWIDIDAIFHSNSTSLQNSPFFTNDLHKTKLFQFTKSGTNNAINAGLFVINLKTKNTNLNAIDILDLFSKIEMENEIKTYSPPYDQHILRLFARDIRYKNIYNEYCIMFDSKQYKLQLFGKDMMKHVEDKNEWFIWHWTGVNERYKIMIPTMKKEILLFWNQLKYDLNVDINLMINNIHSNLNVLIKHKQYKFEPKWIKYSLLCESKWWSTDKQKKVIGHVTTEQERFNICKPIYQEKTTFGA